jgi:hypothetical protein
VFVADDLGAWLVALLADTGRKKLTTLVLGSDQKRALRKAAAAAVRDTSSDMNLSAEQAEQLATLIRRAFRKAVQEMPLAGSVTMLEVLEAAVARQLTAADDADGAAAGHSPTEVLGVPGAALAEKLTGHLVLEITLRGSGGGPLTPLAVQLNQDRTHRMLIRLADEGQGARAQAGSAAAVPVGEADPRRLGVHGQRVLRMGMLRREDSSRSIRSGNERPGCPGWGSAEGAGGDDPGNGPGLSGITRASAVPGSSGWHGGAGGVVPQSDGGGSARSRLRSG